MFIDNSLNKRVGSKHAELYKNDCTKIVLSVISIPFPVV